MIVITQVMVNMIVVTQVMVNMIVITQVMVNTQLVDCRHSSDGEQTILC